MDEVLAWAATRVLSRTRVHPLGPLSFSIRERWLCHPVAMQRMNIVNTDLREQAADNRWVVFSMNMQRQPDFTSEGTKSSQTVHVLIGDDHRLLRQELRTIVSSYPAFHVVGEAADGAQACALAQQVQPDVILMDIQMPKMNGVEATRSIKRTFPHIIIIGLSVNYSIEVAHQMKVAGASAYLIKDTLPEDLCQVIHSALTMSRWIGISGCGLMDWSARPGERSTGSEPPAHSARS